MEKSVKINERCFIRNQTCGRAFGGSRICFLACPSSNDLSLEIDAIKSALRDINIEPYVAIENFEPGKDIFCEKICGKIIEAQFCIVLLSDVKPPKKDFEIPNPNVYYEYGLMVAMHKKVIPLQKEGVPLAFNIQSLDTLPYNPKSLRGVLQTALKSTFFVSGKDMMTDQKYDCMILYKKLSQIENMQIIEKTTLPEPWNNILANTVFEVKQGPLFVGDFTGAYTVDTVISEVKILLNHLYNEILSLQDRIQKAPEESPAAAVYPTSSATYSLVLAESKNDLETKLKGIQQAKVLFIVPDGWKNEVKKAYQIMKHQHKPKLIMIEQQQVIANSRKAGLIPR